MFQIYRTKRFENKVAKLFSPEEMKQIGYFETRQLRVNPYVGKPLNYRFFREKKVGNKRIYYLIYFEMNIVLLIAASTKKEQQKTINAIKEKIPEFKKSLLGYLMQRGVSDLF